MCVLSEKHAKALHGHAPAPVDTGSQPFPLGHSPVIWIESLDAQGERERRWSSHGIPRVFRASFVFPFFFMTPQVVHGSVMRSDVMATAANGADAVGSLPVEVVSQRLQTLLEVIGRSWCTGILKA